MSLPIRMNVYILWKICHGSWQFGFTNIWYWFSKYVTLLDIWLIFISKFVTPW
jgi:hypothetical protein